MNKASLRARRPFLFWSTGIFAVTTGVVLGLLFAMYSGLPAIEKLEEYRPNVVTVITDRNGTPFYELYREKRYWTPYEKIPANLRNAIVSVEDDEFFKHKGVRLLSILRAFVTDVRMRRFAQGGSTITQQLAKVMFLSSKKNISRKIKEALLAIELEKNFTKEYILELYCNQIYMGSRVYGVEAASRLYFGKSVKDITLGQAAVLAALPKAPERYSPLANPEAATSRKAMVLSRMREEGYITAEQEAAALAEPVAPPDDGERMFRALHFAEMIRKGLEREYGAARLYREGMTVHSTLDLEIQQAAEQAVAKGIATINAANRIKGMEAGEGVQAALVAMDVRTGEILAMVGGESFKNSQFNRAAQARRQPGSVFKPVIYLAALEKGFTPASVIVDSPVAYPSPRSSILWKPENYTKKFYGPVTLRKALENSLNVATVKLLHEVGEGSALDAARRLGISTPIETSLAMALGVSEVSMLEMTAAYGALANGGLYIEPTFIKSVADSSGGVIKTTYPHVREAVKPEIAYVITNMLKGAVENGTGQAARIPGRKVAGKTGTTSFNRDAWFVGYTPDLVAAVWVGYDDNRPLARRQTGGGAAAPIWKMFMAKALAGFPASDFPPPPNVVAREIDRESGLLANMFCKDTITEVFVAGMEPVDQCKPDSRFSSGGGF